MTNDILIVGAGPVGLTAALELARRGLKPRIVDAADAPTPLHQSRALAVQPRTLRIMEASGLSAKLVATGNRIHRVTFIENGEPLATLELDALGGPYPFIMAVPQGRTERLLAELLSKHGIEVERGIAFEGLEDPDAPIVRLKRGEAVETARFRAVIGADGVNSAVREAIGVGFEGDRSETAFGLADVQFDRWIDCHEAVVVFTPTGTIAMFPLAHDMARYVGTVPDILSIAPVVPEIVLTTWTSSFHVAFRAASAMQKGNVFLAGDAAHVHSPVGGRGMNLGMEDAACLAWLLWRGGARHYERMRLPAARRVISQTRALTRLIAAKGGVSALARRAVMRGLALPGAARLAARRVTGDDLPPPPWLAEE